MKIMMSKKIKQYLLSGLVCCGITATISSCSDEPDASSFYTFKGQMMSEYLRTHEDFSQFTALVERTGMIELLSTYGEYTCFAPTNEAMDNYLAKKGVSSIDALSYEDCDTLVRTHLVKDMYTTADMDDGVLSTANMNRRYIEVSHGVDEQGNGVVFLNGTSHIIFALQDDSVENGFVQPVTEVLESSNRMILDMLEQNPNISVFANALRAAGFAEALYQYRDEEWDKEKENYARIRYVSHVNKETATVPDEKRIGFTIFVPTDSVLREKYGISTIEQLYEKACEIYDRTYPEDANGEYHDFAHITHEKNPLHRLLAYHILTRDVKGWNYLTPYNDIGIETANDTWSGGLIGSLVGILGGPIGILLGGSMGMLIGGAVDAGDAVENASLVERAGEAIQDGETAMILLAQEEYETALTAKLNAHHVSITRMDAAEVAAEVEHAREVERQMAKDARAKLRAEKTETFKGSVAKKSVELKAWFSSLGKGEK